MTPWSVLLCVSAVSQSGTSDRDALITDARTVVASVVEAARDRKSTKGDALAALYFRAAARAAGKLPEKRAGAAFALGLGVAIDTSDQMRRNLLVGSTWRRVETDDERKARLAVLGTPTLHGRHDLAQHHGVSMALTALLGEKRAESAGLLKELLDANEGGSGFSFADMAANLAGIELAKRMIEKPAKLAGLAKSFEVIDYVVPPKGLPEGLTRAEFEKKYGGASDARYKAARDDLTRRVKGLRGFKEE